MSAVTTYRSCEGSYTTKRRSCLHRAREGFHTCGIHQSQETAVLARHAADAAEKQNELLREELYKATGQRVILWDDNIILQNATSSEFKDRCEVEEVEQDCAGDAYHVLYGARYYDTFKKYHVLYLAPSLKEAEESARQKEYSTWYANALHPTEEEEGL
jgi:hypothetical protein